ncbi:hypothetical protein GCM10009733_037340 [Nonomuraea maheshkhaliensis]|uniref:ABC transporter ATP-binding protein n=1 Tax=Nonomuraea maheshkhaliensis TaxID=419590 RepID=A0ABN2F9N8_9ACTN
MPERGRPGGRAGVLEVVLTLTRYQVTLPSVSKPEVASRTLVMAAQRLRTVRDADHIAFLDEGRVLEEGADEELLSRDGRYATFWTISRA